MKKTATFVIFATLLFAGCTQQSAEPLFAQPTNAPRTASPSALLVATATASAKPSASSKPVAVASASAIAKLTILSLPSVNKSDNARDLKNIDTIVIHTLYNPNAGGDLSITRAKEVLDEASVSSHYVIARDGKVYQLVPEQYQAWHAGESAMPAPDGRTGVNPFSIGIELIATQTSGITRAQYDALTALVLDVANRAPIKHILGHSDIAPGRKTDPWKFDWKTWQKDLTAHTTKSFTFYH